MYGIEISIIILAIAYLFIKPDKNVITVFKVLPCNGMVDRKTFSRFAEGESRVTYELKKWVQAPEWLRNKGYHLFAFSNYEKAEEFVLEAYDNMGGIIYKARAKEVTKILPVKCYREDLANGNLNPKRWDTTWPRDTIMCKKIQILKIVGTLEKGYY